jgi:hypothetical protein
LHGAFFFGQVAVDGAKQGCPSPFVQIDVEFGTGRVVGDQEIQVDAPIRIVGQFKIEKLVFGIFAVPGRNLDPVAALIGQQPDLRLLFQGSSRYAG